MGKSRTTWQPGQSGNPKGRPPKGRALTDRLAAASASKLSVDGTEVPLKDVLARMLWKAAITGQLTFAAPDEEAEERSLPLDFTQWMDITQYIIKQVDGPAPVPIDVTSKGNELKGLTADVLAMADRQAATELDTWEKTKFGGEG